MAAPHRRRLLGWAGAAAALLPLAGCGFALRRAPELPFRRIALVGFSAQTAVAEELRRAMPAGVSVVADPRDAEVVLEALVDRRGRSVAAMTAAGQVRELTLHSRLQYRLATRGGRLLLPPVEVAFSRDLSYSEAAALAKADEERLLWRAMEADIAMQVLRRLAATPAL